MLPSPVDSQAKVNTIAQAAVTPLPFTRLWRISTIRYGVYPNSLAMRNTLSQAMVPLPTMQLMLTLYPSLQLPSKGGRHSAPWYSVPLITQHRETLYPRLQCPHNCPSKGDILLQTTVSSPTAQLMGALYPTWLYYRHYLNGT